MKDCMNNKPIIGVSPLYDKEKESIWMLPGYLNAIIKAGGVPFILPLTCDNDVIKKSVERIDGLVMTGGQDVNPSLYGEKIHEKCGSISDERDNFEMILLEEASKQNMPMLGICRGLQIINVFFGGTLYQDLPLEYPSEIEHRMKAPNNREEHKVKVEKDTILYSLMGEEIGVNSCHHQGIKKLGNMLKSSAFAYDGLIEAFENKEKNIIAVQWHPERLYDQDNYNIRLFEKLIEMSKMKDEGKNV